MELFLNKLATPLGQVLLITDRHGVVRALDFGDHNVRRRALSERLSGIALREGIDTEAVKGVSGKLDRYFSGELAALDEIAVAAEGNDFQRQVWAALREIPASKTMTYGELARSLGHPDPRMAKEVGAAVGANPIAVIIPCHRVIGKDGTLKGYAWGVQRKQWLLMHEKAEVLQVGTAGLFAH